MTLNKAFFDSVREQYLFGPVLTQGVVDTLIGISDFSNKSGVSDKNHLAYIFATALHESYSPSKNSDWLPPREGFAKTNEGAVAAVTALYNKGIIRYNYALPDKVTGLNYYGRGYVQCTFPENYKRMGERLGVDLYGNPDLMLDRGVAVKALVIGMVEGLYTGKKLSDYDSDSGFDFVEARRIINGKDRAEHIADIACKFLNSINIGYYE